MKWPAPFLAVGRLLFERHGPISAEEIEARYTVQDLRCSAFLRRPLPPLRSDGMTEDKALEVRRIFAAIDLAERHPDHPVSIPGHWLP